MALRHSWDYSSAPRGVNCSVHPSDSTDRIHPQSASDAGSRNSGGTTQSATTPDRITNTSIGGLNWVRLRTLTGDNYVAGSGARYRCDYYYTSGQTSVGENTISTYRQRIMVRPGTDYTPDPGNFSTVGWGFHRNGAGFPGGNMWLTYAGTPTNSGNNQILWGTTGENVSSGTFAWAQGGLVLEQYGGPWPTQSQSTTPHYINIEQWQLLPPGSWANKAIDMAWRVKWAGNKTELGEKFYKDYNGGKPTNLSSSGWIELQYRIGTISGGTTTWGNWGWFDGGTIIFANGGQQKWVNGPEPNRHYRPTLFWYQDTGKVDSPYWKGGHNYHEPTSSDSSVYVGLNQISDTFTDMGLAEPGGTPPPPDPDPTLPTLGAGRGRYGNTIIPTASYLATYADRQRGQKISVSDNIENLDTAWIVLQSSLTGTQKLKAVVYDDSGTLNGPGNLIAVSDEVIAICPYTKNWQQFTFSATPALSPGNYWLLLFSGDTSALISYPADTSTGQWANFADTYIDGASNPASGVVLSTQQSAFVLEGDLVTTVPALDRQFTAGSRTNAPRTISPGSHHTGGSGGGV